MINSYDHINPNCFTGTHIALYGFLEYFNKDSPVSLTKEDFIDIINTHFNEHTSVQHADIIFQVTNIVQLSMVGLFYF